jgi:hypothetical protein
MAGIMKGRRQRNQERGRALDEAVDVSQLGGKWSQQMRAVSSITEWPMLKSGSLN